jgi:2-hydroxychromene-2-carboxylate isomerase
VNAALPAVPVWQPVLACEPGAPAGAALPHLAGLDARGRDELVADVERRAAALGLPPVRWPARWPVDAELATLAASFAQASGRVVAFSLAALRQAFAAGRDLTDPDTVLIAAAACELHPRAVLKGVESRSVRDRLGAATEAAVERGVKGAPAVAVGERVFYGEDAVEEAAAAMARA